MKKIDGCRNALRKAIGARLQRKHLNGKKTQGDSMDDEEAQVMYRLGITPAWLEKCWQPGAKAVEIAGVATEKTMVKIDRAKIEALVEHWGIEGG